MNLKDLQQKCIDEITSKLSTYLQITEQDQVSADLSGEQCVATVSIKRPNKSYTTHALYQFVYIMKTGYLSVALKASDIAYDTNGMAVQFVSESVTISLQNMIDIADIFNNAFANDSSNEVAEVDHEESNK